MGLGICCIQIAAEQPSTADWVQQSTSANQSMLLLVCCQWNDELIFSTCLHWLNCSRHTLCCRSNLHNHCHRLYCVSINHKLWHNKSLQHQHAPTILKLTVTLVRKHGTETLVNISLDNTCACHALAHCSNSQGATFLKYWSKFGQLPFQQLGASYTDFSWSQSQTGHLAERQPSCHQRQLSYQANTVNDSTQEQY